VYSKSLRRRETRPAQGIDFLTILRRYIFRETLGAWLVVTVVLLAVLMSNQFARVLGEAATNRVPRDAVLQLMGLTTLNYLTILVPVAFLLGVMLALGRLYRDSEMAAMMACGVGYGTLYRAVLPLVAVVAAALAWLSLEAAPWALRQVEEIQFEVQRSATLGVLEAGRFITLGDPDTVLYAEQVSDEGVLGNLFVQRLRGERIEVILAERGERVFAADGVSQSFVLRNGRRYEGEPGRRDFRLIEFEEHGIPLPTVPERTAERRVEARAMSELLADPAGENLAEIHWRVGVPITLLVVAVLAVPLSRSPPRAGRFGKVGAGILIYLVYTNLLTAGRVALERGDVPAWLGLWWVHALVAGIAAVLLLRDQGLLGGRVAPPRLPSETPA
jgi:lipopolysaccharide export system permease protein